MAAAVPTSASSHAPLEPDDFTRAWELFFRSVRRARARDARLSGGELSLPQYHLLQRLRESPDATVGELAEVAGVAPPTATRMLDCLARDGYVERRASERDRRAVLVSLTPAGKRALDAKHREVLAWRARLGAGLTPEERDQAAVLLRRLAEVIADL